MDREGFVCRVPGSVLGQLGGTVDATTGVIRLQNQGSQVDRSAHGGALLSSQKGSEPCER
jgi:hypothetical protein